MVSAFAATVAEKRTAMDEAKAEARRLAGKLGPGWRPKTWWNMGAGFKASFRGMVHVYPIHRRGKPDKWYCVIGKGGGMLAMLAPDVPHYSDPRRCVRSTVKGYLRKLAAFNAEQSLLVQAGLDSVPKPKARTRGTPWRQS